MPAAVTQLEMTPHSEQSRLKDSDMASSSPPERLPPRRPGRRNLRFLPPADDRPPPPGRSQPAGKSQPAAATEGLRVEVVDVSEPALTLGRPLRHPFIIAAVTQPLRPSAMEDPEL